MSEPEIFAAALRITDAADRAAFLGTACAGDADLRQRVESLLAEQDKLGSFLALPDGPPTTDPPPVERPGTQIGPYKLLQQIGEGGFGIVFMAEQTEPVRRRVALKVIKPGMDTRQVIARFEAERQALAVMDHPNIAKVLDAGEVGQASSLPEQWQAGSLPHPGRPYFVMELVRGVPITQYCDENSLPIRERLALFASVCQAIQHAHTKGIIHRDIKPTNVLVTRQDGHPVVKVIDFGIAKALGQQLTDKTLFTDFAQMIGTPLYMSPEQAELSSTDIDTRSDIYSLGVLLYELLTGTTPVSKEQLKAAAFDEIRRIIREDEPQKPSTRISTADAAPSIAAQRHTEPAKLTKLVRGELDWIVMKALEKDRTRRYETANGLSQDVERYLADEPVLACPPSAGYRLRKFARRNKRALASGALLGLTLLAAVVALAVQNVRIQSQKQKAEEALDARDHTLYLRNIQIAHRDCLNGQLAQAATLLDGCPAPLRRWEWHYVQRRCRTDPVIRQLPDRVSQQGDVVAVSPDSRVVAAACANEALIWEPSGGKEDLVLCGHTGEVRAVAFHPRGRLLASAGEDAQIFIWDLDGAPNPSTLGKHGDGVRGLAFSRSGERLASAGDDGTVIVWDVETRKEAFTLARHGAAVNGVAISPDGSLIASAGSDSVVKIWDARTGRLRNTLRGHKDAVNCAVFSPAGLLATGGGGWDQTVIVWDPASGKAVRQFPRHGGSVMGVAFSPDGERLAAANKAWSVKVWDLRTGEEALTLPCKGMVIGVAFSADGRFLVAAGEDERQGVWTVTVWDGTPWDGTGNSPKFTAR